jgi:hypothetical protein
MNNVYDVWKAMLKLSIKQARQITDDQEALEVQILYKSWDQQIGKQLNVGEYVQHEGKLYRVLQAHVAQSVWAPGNGTESMFVVIDKEHTGTLEDPIPYGGNMELFNGKHYIQNDVVYLCIRDSGTPLYHDLANLIGVYVQTI